MNGQPNPWVPRVICPRCGREVWQGRRAHERGTPLARHKVNPPWRWDGPSRSNPWCNWKPYMRLESKMIQPATAARVETGRMVRGMNLYEALAEIRTRTWFVYRVRLTDGRLVTWHQEVTEGQRAQR